MTIEMVGVLLAAGEGSRFHGASHKLLASLQGTTVFALAAGAATAALDTLDALIVVTGAVTLPLPPDAIHVHNADWATGQASSLLAGIDRADELGAAAVVVGLGDQPFVTAAAWRLVAANPTPIAVATYGGRRGHPVRLDRSVWPLLPRQGDQGARNLMRTRPDLVGEVACPGSPADIDTMEDLHQWNSSTNSQ